ncbi:MAG: methyltransferase [Chloroflexia bacterium]
MSSEHDTDGTAIDRAQAVAETSQALGEMIMGFRVTQMIYVAAKLDIAGLLSSGPRSVQELARTTGTHRPSLYRLLRALASLGIFAQQEDGRFVLTPLAGLLQSGVPGSQRSRALNYGEHYTWSEWGELLHSVTTGETAANHLHGMDHWELRERNPELGAIFNDMMTDTTSSQAASIAEAYDFSEIGTLVDVGGGRGALIAAILQANPYLHGIVCDAPHVVQGARPTLEAAGVLDRCELAPCDFFASVPDGDAHILKMIIHDWDDERSTAILKSCRRAMPAHGRILLVEHVILPGNEPQPGKLLDLQMLVGLGGQERTKEEYGDLLARAGFKLTRVVPTRGEVSIIEARPA